MRLPIVMTKDATVAQEPRMVPGVWLGALADKMKMTGFEWRILVFVIAEGPVSAYHVAKRLGLRYPHAKRAAKELRH